MYLKQKKETKLIKNLKTNKLVLNIYKKNDFIWN
jgi:hypothetical protein